MFLNHIFLLNIEKIWFSKAEPSEECSKIVQAWKKSLVGDLTNDISDTYIKSKITTINNDASSVLETMNVTDESLPPWGGALVESSDMSSQFTNIRTLALAYATYGADLYGNQDVLDKIVDYRYVFITHIYPAWVEERRGYWEMKDGKYQLKSVEGRDLEIDYGVFLERREDEYFLISKKSINEYGKI